MLTDKNKKESENVIPRLEGNKSILKKNNKEEYLKQIIELFKEKK